MTGSQPRSGRIRERGSAVVAVLVLLSAALLVVGGARLFGGAAVEKLRCQGDAVRAIGSGSGPRCGRAGSATAAWLAPSSVGGGWVGRAGAGSGRTPSGTPGRWESSATNIEMLGLEDRQRLEVRRSREALAPLFQVVESGSGRAAENQVTADQFEDVVRLYHDVRLARTSIQPAEESAPHWDAMMADLALILETESGRELVRRLAQHERGTRMSPAYRLNQAGEPDPALGLDTSNGFAESRGRVGTVTYPPGEWVRFPDADLTLDPWALTRSDVLLYHEMVHILDFHDQTAWPWYDFDDNMDFVPLTELRAVGLGRYKNARISENAYRAARREIGALGVGAAEGDADMPHRPRYYTQIPATEPPGPRPAPPAGDP